MDISLAGASRRAKKTPTEDLMRGLLRRGYKKTRLARQDMSPTIGYQLASQLVEIETSRQSSSGFEALS